MVEEVYLTTQTAVLHELNWSRFNCIYRIWL